MYPALAPPAVKSGVGNWGRKEPATTFNRADAHKFNKNMKNFFQNPDTYTEFLNTKTGEVWVFGDAVEKITEQTPCMFVGADPRWGNGDEQEAILPVIDGHGNVEYVSGRVYEGTPGELEGTTAEKNISKFYTFNI